MNNNINQPCQQEQDHDQEYDTMYYPPNGNSFYGNEYLFYISENNDSYGYCPEQDQLITINKIISAKITTFTEK